MPARWPYQQPIIFRKVKSWPEVRTDNKSNNQAASQFSHYEQIFYQMMKKMSYNLTRKLGLNFGRGRQDLLCSFIPQEKNPDYYHKTCRGLRYIITFASSERECEELTESENSKEAIE